MKYCESCVFVGKLSHSYVLFVLLTWVADQGPSKTVAFFRIPSKIFMSGTWNFRIIKRNIKAIFRDYFSSLRFDSGKIFKFMTFRRGPKPNTVHLKIYRLPNFNMLFQFLLTKLPKANYFRVYRKLITGPTISKGLLPFVLSFRQFYIGSQPSY